MQEAVKSPVGTTRKGTKYKRRYKAMTPEKIYENVCTMLREYDNATGNGAAGQ